MVGALVSAAWMLLAHNSVNDNASQGVLVFMRNLALGCCPERLV
jgi:hypothetical protein